jgi:hypothetical protein
MKSLPAGSACKGKEKKKRSILSVLVLAEVGVLLWSTETKSQKE